MAFKKRARHVVKQEFKTDSEPTLITLLQVRKQLVFARVEHVEATLADPMAASPGEYIYSSTNYLVLGLLLSFPACNMQTSETAKEFYLEQMEKTKALQAEEAKHAEKKEVKHAEKQSEPAPAKLVPDGK